MDRRRQAIAEAMRKKHEGPSLAEAVGYEDGISSCQTIGAVCVNDILLSGTSEASPVLNTKCWTLEML